MTTLEMQRRAADRRRAARERSRDRVSAHRELASDFRLREAEGAARSRLDPELSSPVEVKSRRTVPARMAEVRFGPGLALAQASAGLVNVITTHTGFEEHQAAARAARLAETAHAAGAFPIDAAKRRRTALRAAVGWASRAHSLVEPGYRSDVAWMVTLTYAGDNADWRPEHLTRAVTAFRNWCTRQGAKCRYVWVAELQKRGVIHYHLVAWLPKRLRMPKWDKKGWWSHGMTQTIQARNATGYLISYLKKCENDERGTLPKGARAYGIGGLEYAQRRARRWLRLPKFVQANGSVWDLWDRADGGGWTAPNGGWWPSEFERVIVGSEAHLRRVERHPRLIEPAGPFSWISDRVVALSKGAACRS